MNNFYTFLLVFTISVFNICWGSVKENLKSDPEIDNKFEILTSNIENVLKRYDGLCVGIALVNADGKIDVTGLGTSNAALKQAANSNTMFRIASISKMFVALAILKLQEEGKLKLSDKIKDIVPEVAYKNPWEDTDPVRIVHLLEHTTGWDEIHLAEIAYNTPTPITLKKALEFHPHSRKSRWMPGSRKAYCNSGYAVAAYIVEKISGQEYEEYVKETFFKPLKMPNTTFFNDELFHEWGATTFNWAMKQIDYKPSLYRPSASLNSSPGDMAKLLQLLLNRGSIDTLKLLEEKSIKRMEKPKSTPGAKAGLALGYGLGSFTSTNNGFVYHGHEGVIDGGLSELAYIPKSGVGHVLLLNANNGQAMSEISTLIREYETALLETNTAKTAFAGEIDIAEGYYVAINPRSQDRFYQDLIFDIHKIEVFDNHITKSWILPGAGTKYYPVSPSAFLFNNTNKIGLVKATDPLAGEVLYTHDLVLKPISSVRVFGQFSILMLWIIFMVIGCILVLILFTLFLMNSKKYRKAFHAFIFPTLATISVILLIILPRLGINHIDILLSKPGIWSISLMVLSVLFVLSSLGSVITVYKLRNRKINKIIFWPSIILSCLHLMVTAYLILFGVVPMMTWT